MKTRPTSWKLSALALLPLVAGTPAALGGDACCSPATTGATRAAALDASGVLDRSVVAPCRILRKPGRGGEDRGLTSPVYWPTIVPYAFDPNTDAFMQAQTEIAIDIVESVCDVVFVPRTSESDFVVFTDSTGNSSFLGRVGGPQPINMFNWSFEYIIVHEIKHALGFYHEHQRPDRDTFITVNTSNIDPSFLSQFTIEGGADPIGPYDFESVMHYGRFAFTNNGFPTITLNPGYTQFTNVIGNRSSISAGDAAALAAVYGDFDGAPGVWMAPESSLNMKYIDPSTGEEPIASIVLSPASAGGLAIVGGEVWHGSDGDSRIRRYDKSTREFLGNFSYGNPVLDLREINAGEVWVASPVQTSIGRRDASGAALSPLPLPAGTRPTAIAQVGSEVWVGALAGSILTVVDTAGNELAQPATPGLARIDTITPTGSNVWLNRNGESVIYLYNNDATPTGVTVDNTDAVSDIELVGDEVWVASNASPTIRVYDADGTLARSFDASEGIDEILSFVPVACPGDVNGDGAVDVSDFFLLGGNFGTTSGATRSDGDLNDDGAVDVSDFFILGGNFGSVCPVN